MDAIDLSNGARSHDFGGRAGVVDSPVGEEHGAVRVPVGLLEPVEYDQHAEAPSCEAPKDLMKNQDVSGVEGRGGLVEQEGPGAGGERSSDHHLLLLPARELRKRAVGQLEGVDLAKGSLHRFPVGTRGTGQRAPVREAALIDDVSYAEQGVEAGPLRDVRDRARAFERVQLAYRLAIDADFASASGGAR